MRNHACLALAVLVLAARPAKPDVLDSAANGFTVKVTVSIQASPDDVYRRLVGVADWWNPAHTFSGDAHNLSLDAKATGCFCEKLPNQGSVRHLEVVYAAPGKSLVLAGALGPLQSIAATGSMKMQLSPAGAGTKLEVTYTVVGYQPAGMTTWAVPVDSVLTEQFTRLKNYIERGSPAPK
jgi:uncharacterized protein YndB with AHSA1/START domain